MPRETTPTRAFDWRTISDDVQFAAGWPALSASEIPRGDPAVENQIGDAEHPWAIEFFQQFHLPMLRSAGVNPQGCRVLELGAGFGRLAYGTLNSIQPEFYVATDVFPQLVETLAGNLPRWTRVPAGAALLDPQDRLLFRPGAFNVIQSHSVLHHVLDYRAAVRALYARLDTPGVLIFCEPCLEGHLFLLMVVRMFRQRRRLAAAFAEQILGLERYILQRSGPRRRDRDFLSGFGAGDKHLYSAYDLMDLAEETGARFYAQNDTRPLHGNLMFELQLRGADAGTLAEFDRFLTDLLPEGVENAYFSDLRQVFCLRKG